MTSGLPRSPIHSSSILRAGGPERCATRRGDSGAVYTVRVAAIVVALAGSGAGRGGYGDDGAAGMATVKQPTDLGRHSRWRRRTSAVVVRLRRAVRAGPRGTIRAPRRRMTREGASRSGGRDGRASPVLGSGTSPPCGMGRRGVPV